MEPAPSRVCLRFYAELNDHLPRDQRHKTLEKRFFVAGPVKDIIESFGVPHTEIELIVANGESVPFSYVVHDGDRIAVYPMFESFDVAPELKLRRDPLREPRFVLDVHLGRLAAYLRMLGFDAMYANSSGDPELVRVSSEQRRILLTRDRGLLMHRDVTHGYLVRHTNGRCQLAEVVARFDLVRSIQPFTRCMACNGVLVAVTREQALPSLPPRIAASCQEFLRCPRCGRTYWQGSHYRRMERWITDLTASANLPVSST